MFMFQRLLWNSNKIIKMINQNDKNNFESVNLNLFPLSFFFI